MATDLETIRKDRKALQARWREEGYYQGKTLSQALYDGVRASPEVSSVFHQFGEDIVRTNREIFDAGVRLASALGKLGVGAGDVVAVQLPTWLETGLIYQAIAHLGAVTLPIVSVYGEAEVEYILKQSQAKILFSPGSWRNREYYHSYSKFLGNEFLRKIIVVGNGNGNYSNSTSLDRVILSGEISFEPIDVDPNDVCCLIYTSGTTSAPKGVRHTHNSLLWEWGRPTFANRGTYLSILPAGHITGYGYLLRHALYGVPQVFMDHWDPQVAVDLIARYSVQSGGGTPTFLHTLLEAADKTGADISSLTSFSMGGQGITPAQVQIADERGFCGARVYGSTEHPTVTFFDPDESFEKRAYTDGKIDRGNEVRIVDDQDCDLTLGSEGNILSRGPDLFSGYSEEALDRETFLPGGWYRTGDIGRVDAEGYLTITDRKKDIIIRGGENLSSIEVEGILLRHPSVRDAAAVAMPDPVYGEKVCAFVVLRPEHSLTLEDVGAHFRAAGVAVQKTPERIEEIESLPRNASGKIKKDVLRQIVRDKLL